MGYRVLPPGDQWRKVVNRLPPDLQDPHWHPGLCAAFEMAYGGKVKAQLFVVEDADQFVMQPMLLWQSDRVARSPYNFGGPIGSQELADEFQVQLDGMLSSLGMRETCTLNPLLCAQQRLLSPGHVVRLKDVVVMDLLEPNELRSTTRHAAEKAQISGVMVAASHPVALRNADLFEKMYDLTMERRGAATHWRYPAGYFRALTTVMPEQTALLFALVNGEVESGCLLLFSGKTAYYHYAGSRGRHPGLGAGHLLVLQAARWAREAGCEVLCLGGGVHKGDGLEQFKCGFSPHRRPVYYYERELARAAA
jgi:Acetyltransferase (GNAT) domain